MEDRIEAGLYLEMTDQPLEGYTRARLPEVIARPDVRRATWWQNVRPGREDLPRVLDEFTHLGLYEVGPSFRAPATPAGITGHHFQRCPRPGQGCLTGRPTIGLSLVLISPTAPDKAQALRDWGDFVHIRHIAEVGVPGYAMITPYERVGGGDPRFLHLYEMDTDDPERAFKAMTPLVEERVGRAGTREFQAWAFHPALRIMYVNTFRRMGARDA